MTKYTTKGLEARRDAELTGKPIVLKTFKVCDEDIEDFENATVEDLPSFWIEKPITYFTPIGQTGLQFECRVLQDEAVRQGRYFALYLENGDCYLVSKAPGVFNANIEQRFRIKRDFINNNSNSYDCTFIDRVEVDWDAVLNKPSIVLLEDGQKANNQNLTAQLYNRVMLNLIQQKDKLLKTFIDKLDNKVDKSNNQNLTAQLYNRVMLNLIQQKDKLLKTFIDKLDNKVDKSNNQNLTAQLYNRVMLNLIQQKDKLLKTFIDKLDNKVDKLNNQNLTAQLYNRVMLNLIQHKG